ncbi:Hypothetical predicted protein [Pelobates cultripes]|uniref:Uncharacterized protein n=1 Tax=Pelobates cultripes TaxID=61616 RepID=A0AAD1R591_PELCU|nr:Hypothetical predicted protein [Pelobates cultripes]
MADATYNCNGGRVGTDVLERLDAIFDAFWANLAHRERQTNIQANPPRDRSARAGRSISSSEATTR